jgi:MFS family permease
VLEDLAFILAAYTLGSVPSSLLLGRLSGHDLRTEGSRNIGAGNLTRLAGLPWGVIAAIADALKGLVPVLLAHRFGLPQGIAVTAGVAAVAGHNWSLFLNFRGGRGLATSVGVVLGLDASLILWPLAWAVAGWSLGGGIGGFIGWAPLGLVASTLDKSQMVVTGAYALGVLAVVRRMQGNRGTVPTLRTAVYRAVHDAEPVGDAPAGQEAPGR